MVRIVPWWQLQWPNHMQPINGLSDPCPGHRFAHLCSKKIEQLLPRQFPPRGRLGESASPNKQALESSARSTESMKYHRFLSIPVLVVLATVGSIYYVTVFIFLEDWLGLQSSAGSLNALIFTFLASLCFVSFFACVLTDPGGVPSSYVPDVEDHATSDQQPIKTGIQRKRCDKCSVYKPPRTHHCRSCRRCILRMDHHFIWINNCVGLRNYKAFFVLVAYTTMASIYSSVAVLFARNGIHGKPTKPFFLNSFTLLFGLQSMILSGVVVVGLSMTLGTLFCWHVYLVVHNMTTIEHYEAIRAAWLAKKSGQSYHHPFDVGAYKNLTLVLGPNMLKWLCPTAVSHIKDGITFPTAHFPR
ncbi:unnamed protein product [Thlaspi arvense]|uniref:S-acyltransferase n=1 Tax=Thlaspi arvense TaxID=13288 RepID=A0AAU9RUI4_THLAR|nr:unnamed protein product [Thlaspi arvense]